MEGRWRNQAMDLAGETDSWLPPDPHRLIGEDAPTWLAGLFAVVGTLIAVASTSIWVLAPSAPSPAAHPPVAAIAPRVERVRPAPQPEPEAQPSTPSRDIAAAPTPPVVDAAPQAEPDFEPPATETARRTPSAPPTCFTGFNIAFAHDSSMPIIKGVEPSIEALRRFMTQHSDAVLLIEGHTDTIGPEQHNVLLSFSRAKAVASLLTRLGVPERRITIRAAGANAATEKAGQFARNRRAFLRVEGVENCSGADVQTENQ